MRVAHIESGRHLYGGGAEVRYLVGGLAAARVDNVLLCAAGGELAERCPDAQVVALPMAGDLDLSLIARARRALRAVKPDIVHVHSRRGADLYGGVAAALEGIPAIVTRRVDSPEPALWARLKYRLYARVVALSRTIEAQLVGCGLARDKVVRIPSAVDTGRFRPEPSARARLLEAFALPADALVVGVVAQLIARKRHEWLLEELPELVRRDPRIRVLCFGRGPLEDRLRAAVAARGLERHVVLAGFRDDLAELLPGLDVLAHPAEREGLGVALLEAASCGVAVVAAAAGGVLDVIEHGRTGVLVAPDDALAFVGALKRLLANPLERAALGAAARADMQRRFSIQAMVSAHLDLYSAVLREPVAAEAARRAAAREPRETPR
jgi:glycosyltransferase involved in cell wall biosynthesis